MAKIGIIFPYKEMEEMARPLITQRELDIVYMKTAQVADVVTEARRAIEAGAEIIISRGYEAMLVRKYTNVPLVEMKIEFQEIGKLIRKAKKMLPKDNLKIALICFRNMIDHMDGLGDLLDVELKLVYIDRSEECVDAVRQLKQDKIDLVIGGESIVQEANAQGLPALQYYFGSEHAILVALEEADRLQYAMEVEKSNAAQLESILDTSFNGIIKINSEGTVTVINHLVENLIGKGMEDVIGKHVLDIFPEFDGAILQDILTGRRDQFIISVNIRKQAWILNMAPIQYDETITGAILSLQRMVENSGKNADARKKMMLTGYTTDTMFSSIQSENPTMLKQLELARKYALSERPVVIYAEGGTEYFRLAEAIHCGSAHRSSPFVSANMEAMNEDEQMRSLFGKTANGKDYTLDTIFHKAQQGTVFISNIDKMGLCAQNLLFGLLVNQEFGKTDVEMSEVCAARVIVSSKRDLKELVESGEFSSDLFYYLQGLGIHIPPMRERKKDIKNLFETEFGACCKRYNKYLTLTEGAVKQVLELPWNGNQMQIRAFCETLVVRMDRRRVDEVEVQRLYQELYPAISVIEGRKQLVIYKEQEAERIEKLLEKYYGNRNAVAKELGISTTTLWRKMKKYGITSEVWSQG